MISLQIGIFCFFFYFTFLSFNIKFSFILTFFQKIQKTPFRHTLPTYIPFYVLLLLLLSLYIARKVQILAASCMRTLFWTGSFHYIRYKGVRATTKQAPIVCGAPHTSFYDSILAIILGPSAVVAKSETADMSFFGSKQTF